MSRRTGVSRNIGISIHALREEGDARRARRGPLHRGFLSTPSARRATAHPVSVRFAMGKFLSTPSARRATLTCLHRSGAAHNFYPRPPRGGRHKMYHNHADVQGFLSTPSARRATTGPCRMWRSRWHFYPRPPRGGRRGHDRQEQAADGISIHALREEGDPAQQVSRALR